MTSVLCLYYGVVQQDPSSSRSPQVGFVNYVHEPAVWIVFRRRPRGKHLDLDLGLGSRLC